MREARSRLAEVDLLRVMALIGVVTIHAAAWIVPVNEPPTHGPIATLAAFARFSVPAFLVASGLVVYRAYGRPDRPVSFLRRRWTRVLLPWLLWVPVYIGFYLVVGEVTVSPKPVVDWLASGPGLLYFLLLIAQFYLLLLVMPRSRVGLALFAAGAFAVQLPLDWLHTYHPIYDIAIAYPLNYLAQEEAPFWAGYFALGCLIGAEYERIRLLYRWWPLAVAGVAGSMGLVALEAQRVPDGTWTTGLYAFFWPSMVPLTVTTVLSVLWLGHWLRPHMEGAGRFLNRFSRYSLGIYLVHTFVLDKVAPHTIGIAPLPRLVLLVAVSILVAWPVVALLATTTLGALSIGERKRPPAALEPELERPAERAA
jgi:surface polysaccharide O-acyltransferase-like enzyme